MKSVALLATVAAVFTLSSASALAAPDADAAQKYAKDNGCTKCHAVDKTKKGPSYKKIAAKYKGMEAAKLAASIKAGGSGKWGAVPMPAQAALKDDEAKLLAEWVLAGAPDK